MPTWASITWNGMCWRCGYTLQRIHSDYGYDLVMWTYNLRREIESGITYFQVKATDSLPMLKDGKTISWPVDRRDLRLWLKDAYPVILVVYDAARDRAYWLYVQAYFIDRSTADLFTGGEMINVHVPTKNRINRRSIQEIAEYQRRIRGQLTGRVHHDV